MFNLSKLWGSLQPCPCDPKDSAEDGHSESPEDEVSGSPSFLKAYPCVYSIRIFRIISTNDAAQWSEYPRKPQSEGNIEDKSIKSPF